MQIREFEVSHHQGEHVSYVSTKYFVDKDDFGYRNKFIWSSTKESLQTIPGIGKACEGTLGNELGGGSIRNTSELLIKFMSLRTPEMSNSDHFTEFTRWLCIKGISNFKNDIVVAVAGKTCLLLMIVYLHYRHLIIDPPE